MIFLKFIFFYLILYFCCYYKFFININLNMNYNIDEKFKNYDFFLDNINQKIKINENQINENNKKIENIKNLEEYIENLIMFNQDKYNIEIDIGNGIYVSAENDFSKKTIIINIGSNYYAEIPFEEALEIIRKQRGVLERKNKLIEKEYIKNRSYSKLTKILYDSLKNQQFFDNINEQNNISEIDNIKNSNINSINI